MNDEVKVESLGKIFNIKTPKPPKILCSAKKENGFVVVTVRMPVEMYNKVCEKANEKELTISEIIRRAVIYYLDRMPETK